MLLVLLLLVLLVLLLVLVALLVLLLLLLGWLLLLALLLLVVVFVEEVVVIAAAGFAKESFGEELGLTVVVVVGGMLAGAGGEEDGWFCDSVGVDTKDEEVTGTEAVVVVALVVGNVGAKEVVMAVEKEEGILEIGGATIDVCDIPTTEVLVDMAFSLTDGGVVAIVAVAVGMGAIVIVGVVGVGVGRVELVLPGTPTVKEPRILAELKDIVGAVVFAGAEFDEKESDDDDDPMSISVKVETFDSTFISLGRRPRPRFNGRGCTSVPSVGFIETTVTESTAAAGCVSIEDFPNN